MKKNPLSDDLEHMQPSPINWYPGHMARAIKEIKEKLPLVDIVFEIRDARAPLASGNSTLDETLRQKSRLILLNKANLADPNKLRVWEEWFKNSGYNYVFIDCFDKTAMKKVMTQARAIVQKKREESNPGQAVKSKVKIMLIGLPNTGKSTIINQLAGKNVVRTADKPGHTQTQQWIVVDKDCELMDTPGVMPPKIAREEHGLWLSAINAIPDDVVGIEKPARYLVEYFKSFQSREFQARYKLESFDLDVESIIQKIAQARGCIKQKGEVDFERVYKLILLDFRNGEFGKCCFGIPPA
jgi:ribosome biogenesis GTPase A